MYNQKQLHIAVEHHVALAPVPNVLNSLSLLHQLGRMPALARWVQDTAAQLTPQQLATNRLVWAELRSAVLPHGSWPDVAAFLAGLAAEQPAEMRGRVVEQHEQASRLSPAAEALLADPSALHDLVVSHLSELWERFAAPEWARVQRTLQHQAGLLSRSSPDTGIAPDAIAANLDTYIGSQAVLASEPGGLVYVPSAHTGRYVTQLNWGRVRYLFFDAELHTGVLLRDSAIKPIELVGRLSAIAEPSRLRVLALLAQHTELTLQDLMAMLDTSQPNVSRYLKSLGSFVREQRGKDGRKRYRLVPSELDATFHALKQTVLAPPAPVPQQEQAMQALDIVNFIDAHGAVIIWPRQQEPLRLVLGYLADRFAPDKTYSEREINAVLQHYVLPHVRDHLNVRRELIDAQLLERSADGAQYRRTHQTEAQPQHTPSDEEAYDRYWGG